MAMRKQDVSASDFTISSRHDDDEPHLDGRDGGIGRAPLNSTLMTGQAPAHVHRSDRQKGRQARERIPETFLPSDPMTALQQQGRVPTLNRASLFRQSDAQERDLTLSTQTESVVDEHLPARRNKFDASLLPGVGHGYDRKAHTAPYERFQPHRSERDEPAQGNSILDHMRRRSDSEDSESAVESVSGSSTDGDAGNAFPHRMSLAESTGNHQGFMRSPRVAATASSRPKSEKVDRPTLPQGWQKGLDEVFDHQERGTSKKSVGTTFSARSHPSLRNAVADAIESGSNESGYAAGSQQNRKSSAASSKKGKSRAGTDASTSGETLVGELGFPNGPTSSSHLLLPSGQKLGKGIPSSGFSFPRDMSGVSMALESPVKHRVGVQHQPIDPEHIQAFAAPIVRSRRRDFDGLQSYIHRVEQKVDRVENVSSDMVKEVTKMRKQWSDWQRGQKPGVRHHGSFMHSPPKSSANLGADEEMHRRYHVNLANCEHLKDDIGVSIDEYRKTLADLQEQEQELVNREKQRRKKYTSAASLPRERKSTEARGQEEVEDGNESEADSLRAQVDAVAREVERLKAIVHLREEKKLFVSLSSPLKPTQHRSIGVGGEFPFGLPRKGSDGGSRNVYAKQGPYNDQVDGNEHDKIHSASPLPDDVVHPFADMEDIGQLANIRAEKAFSRAAVGQNPSDVDVHDVHQCAHCARQNDVHRRKEQRKHAAMQEAFGRRAKARVSSSSIDEEQEERSAAQKMLEEALLELETVVGGQLPPALLQLANKQRTLLERTIKEEVDEFYHARCTYAELADELKTFSPEMSKTKRRILADHVLVSVEALEMRANRIERLRAALATTLPGIAIEGFDHVTPRNVSSTSSGKRGFRPRPRNSPPIMDDGAEDVDMNNFRRIFHS